ncbi:MAG: sodium:solute symporter family transporter, partial [Polyangiales bacterium]
DFVQTARPEMESEQLARWGRGAIIVFMIFAVVWTPQISRFPTLWQYLQSILSYLTPPVVAVFLLGLFWPRANNAGALAGLLVGVPLGVLGWVSVELLSVFEIQYLYAAVLMFGLGLALVVVGSLVTAAPARDEIGEHLWKPSDADVSPGEPWYRDYRVQAVFVASVTAGVVIWWW